MKSCLGYYYKGTAGKKKEGGMTVFEEVSLFFVIDRTGGAGYTV